jgi:hypothetical protein
MLLVLHLWGFLGLVLRDPKIPDSLAMRTGDVPTKKLFPSKEQGEHGLEARRRLSAPNCYKTQGL